jgi:ABC-type glycerol-3-phosphate transport system substrate-binding protein
MNIILGNWYWDWDANTRKAANTAEQNTINWRKQIQKDHNFTISEKLVATYDQMQQKAAVSIISGAPIASAFIVEPSWAMAMIKQGLVYPVSDITDIDMGADKPMEWNQLIRDSFTFNGKTYAFNAGYDSSKHAGGVFFNKRLFQEAGIDPNLPYDKQKDGTWTWDVFMDLCQKLTRDTNNDGIIDTYALATQHTTTLDEVIASNGADWVMKDPKTGKFENGIKTPQFLEALQWAYQFHAKGYLMPQPENSSWDWYKNAFITGKAAMMVDQQYCSGDIAKMKDDWGFVLFPKGPKMKTYRYPDCDNVWIIPSTFKKADAEKILYGFMLWNTPAPENRDPDAWKIPLYSEFRDSRAVDETLAIIHEHKYAATTYYSYIPGLERGDIGWKLWWDGVDPAQLIETVEQSWDATIAKANPN